ncbi:transposase [Streptomyces mauvecolor]
MHSFQQVARAIEEGPVEAHSRQHPAADIVLSQPGLGVVLGARVLAEFGDDPTRYVSAKARKNYAGTSPITRASGRKKVALARYVNNDRLIDALLSRAFSTRRISPNAHAYYQRNAPAESATTPPCASSPPASSASSTDASKSAPATTIQPPGHITPHWLRVDAYAPGMSLMSPICPSVTTLRISGEPSDSRISTRRHDPASSGAAAIGKLMLPRDDSGALY